MSLGKTGSVLSADDVASDEDARLCAIAIDCFRSKVFGGCCHDNDVGAVLGDDDVDVGGSVSYARACDDG